jgi:CRISPR-associated protein Cmr3
MIRNITINPRDPLIARDGRPFGARRGNRMRSLDWLYPSVLAGSLRTLLGKQVGGNFDAATIEALKHVALAGPLPLVYQALFFPRPLDCVVREDKNGSRKSISVRPAELVNGEGCELPAGLLPVLLPDKEDDFKPAKQPSFWNCAKMAEWLRNSSGTGFPEIPITGSASNGFLDAPPKDFRTHVKMDPGTGAGMKEDALFMTTGLDFSRKYNSTPVQLAARVESNGNFDGKLAQLDALHPLGGERRLVHWGISNGASNLWSCPQSIKGALDSARRVRMVLATPAIFSGGWKPTWLGDGDDGLCGRPPGSDVTLRLVGAVINRWQPVSGWSLEPPIGPKPIRRLVPAGSVYFFEVASGKARTLADRWLRSVCDDDQDCRDGFGLVLWGVWDEHSSPRKGA